jgi:hypothetical protein
MQEPVAYPPVYIFGILANLTIGTVGTVVILKHPALFAERKAFREWNGVIDSVYGVGK